MSWQIVGTELSDTQTKTAQSLQQHRDVGWSDGDLKINQFVLYPPDEDCHRSRKACAGEKVKVAGYSSRKLQKQKSGKPELERESCGI